MGKIKRNSEARLTPKQQRFCEEYLIDLNASDATRRAGYSPKTAFRSGQENMQKHAIKAAIQKAISVRSDRT
ncbi:MAG: terminase small subunit [Pseudomonadota bacterium]|nr:terminase small subunit [Pseudomonadota bacterium]